MYALPSKELKHLFSLLVGLALVQWIFGPDWIHSLLSSAVTYLICALAPKKYIHVLVFVWVMGYMTGAHAYRMYVSYLSGIFDFTGTQMVLTMKLTSFAYNLYDGTADRERVFPATPYADKRLSRLYNERRRFAIRQLPNPLEFFGYVFCFTCILAGPAFEYSDYQQAIDGSAFEQKSYAAAVRDDEKVIAPNGTKKDASSTVSSGKVVYPSTLLPALQRLLVGVVTLAGHLVLVATYQVSSLYNADFIANTPALARMFYAIVALFTERLKYYFAWKVAEGASILAGFGFEGYTPEGKVIGWKGVENIDILGFETSASVQTMTRTWNKRTQGWLERYTYQRTGRSLVATYFVSALWHGLYPGFFFFFMTLPIITRIERLLKSKVNPLVVPEYDGYDLKTYPKTPVGYIYWIICWIGTFGAMLYVGEFFFLGSLENCMVCLRSYYFIPHIFLLLVYIVLSLMPTSQSDSRYRMDTTSKFE